jgi:hypothetical protein
LESKADENTVYAEYSVEDLPEKVNWIRKGAVNPVQD